MKKSVEFHQLICDIIEIQEVRNMRNLKQHTNQCSLLEHCLYTAYLTYRICDKWGLDCKQAVRGAVLHDFRLDDNPDNKTLRFHGRDCEKTASLYFNLSNKEKNIIISHMWPFNFKQRPQSKEAVVVCLVDTYCAVIEKLHIYNHTKTTQQISKIALSQAS